MQYYSVALNKRLFGAPVHAGMLFGFGLSSFIMNYLFLMNFMILYTNSSPV